MKKVGNYKTVKIIGISLFLILVIAVLYVFNIKKMPTIYSELDITKKEYQNFIDSKTSEKIEENEEEKDNSSEETTETNE